MEPLTPIQQLDKVLAILAERNLSLYKQFGTIATQMIDTASMPDILLILNKLIKDRFAEHRQNRLEPDPLKQEYCITFEGKFFIENGGYSEDIKFEKSRKAANSGSNPVHH